LYFWWSFVQSSEKRQHHGRLIFSDGSCDW
jgi:hypothetical protein